MLVRFLQFARRRTGWRARVHDFEDADARPPARLCRLFDAKKTAILACTRQDVCYSFYRTKTFPGGAVVAQLTVNQRVAGSNPARGARTFNPAIGRVFLFGFWVMRALLTTVFATATAWASGFYVAPVTL